MAHFNRRKKNPRFGQEIDLESLNYKITFEPTSSPPKGMENKMERLLMQAKKGSYGIIERLKKYVKQHPEDPTLKNYLFLAYQSKGKRKEAERIVNQTIEQHPDYLFSKINLAAIWLEKEQPEKVPEVLGESLELSLLYPDRDTFHFTEALSFLAIVGQYFLAIGEEKQAEERLYIMKEIDEDDYRVEYLANLLLAVRMERMIKRAEKSEKLLIEVESFPTVEYEASSTFPELENDILEAFYQYIPEELPQEIIEAIKALDRESLIRDLELIIIDSIKRFDWFIDHDGEHEENQEYFQVHALYWLGALEAKESLPVVLDMLRQGETFLNYWFGDMLRDLIFEALYLLSKDQLPILKQFVLEDNLYCYARLLVCDVVEQVSHHQRNRHKEVVQWFEEVFQFHLDHPDKKGIIDTNFLSWAVSNLTKINAPEMLPLVEKLFEKDWIDEVIIGDIANIEKELKRPHNPGDKDPMPENIDEFYSLVYSDRREERVYTQEDLEEIERLEKIMENDLMMDSFAQILEGDFFGEEMEEEFEEDYLDYEEVPDTPQNITPIRKNPKVGRNEPCPCGSGKKYKKCCLHK